MYALIKNIWQAPAATAACAICLALTVLTGSEIEMPKELVVGLLALSAFLSGFSGPNKPKTLLK